MSAKADCACTGARPCLLHFDELPPAEQARVLYRLRIRNARPIRWS